MLTPAASAVDRTSLVLEQGECSLSEMVGAYADVYCNPYEISDLDTIEIDPLELFLKIRNDGSMYKCMKRDKEGKCIAWEHWPTNFKYTGDLTEEEEGHYWHDVQVDSSGNPVINTDKESKLGTFAIACGTRTAPLGLASSEVASLVSGEVNGVIGSLPIIGDIATAANAAENAENVNWINGQYCVASEQNELWEDGHGLGSGWYKRYLMADPNASLSSDTLGLRWYQRYLEDQNWMEAAGLVGQSSSVALLEDYYDEHPLDNSYEGTLARFSGLSKETVEDTLALIDYYQWLAEYDPSELGPVKPVPAEEIGVVEQVFSEVGKVAEIVGIVYERVVYGERRTNARIA